MIGWLTGMLRAAAACAMACGLLAAQVHAGAAGEYAPLTRRVVSIGPEASRLIVGLRRPDGDVDAAAQRAHLAAAGSRRLTPQLRVLVLPKTLYGADVEAALRALRADPAVKYADADQRRYPSTLPNDPLFAASTNASGQWFMLTPSSATPTSDAAATDAVSAWAITTGSSGTVIADIDTGVLFNHPDLQRAGFGGRLLPGYDFVSGDLNRSNSASLGTFLIANDGDGWDPDPSDPGDWISMTDQNNPLFPAADCPVSNSSWHGTRVMGILGALTNNAIGVAGMTWNPYLLPVRALGKCGGYDSDIITGMNWAAGLPVEGVPANPYPASLINLSLGGSGACPTAYSDAIAELSAAGVLVVASAGNESGAVDAPANCPGVLAVAGLRNVGTKVGYSSLGPEVGIAAPAGNCVNSSLPCLRSIDTTTNSGLTAPADSIYTNQDNPNLGTSFSAPIVTGIVALMRAVNANLTPPQLIARIEASATAFPQPAGVPVCPAADATTGECACPIGGGQCGAGMANALQAVSDAQRPIAAVQVPANTGAGASSVLDASGSAPACGRQIVSYAWSAVPAALIQSAANAAQVTVLPTSAGTLTLTVTDSAGAVDTAALTVDAAGIISPASGVPATAGNTPCPTALAVVPAAPTVAVAFQPTTVSPNTAATLTITLGNSNGFALTGAALPVTLPANLSVAAAGAGAAATTCGGAAAALITSNTTGVVTLSGATIPAAGTCQITIPVQSAEPGSYSYSVVAGALATGPAGTNAAGTSAVLTVAAPSGGGGGAWDWWDSLCVVGVLLAARRHGGRRRSVSN